MRMGHTNAFFHLQPIIMSNNVSLVHLIRPLPPMRFRKIEKLRYYEINNRFLLTRLWLVYRKAIKLGKSPKVKSFVSFFAFPYGLIAVIAGLRTGKPVHIGFVGSDWYKYCQTWYRGFIDFFVKKATLITVPGFEMKKEMEARNYPPEKIFCLPHAVDIGEYTNKLPEKRKYDCIFVGYLYPIKRVDLIISAIGIVKNSYPHINLCIVGDGPLRNDLESQVSQLGLNQNVSFVGFQTNPSKWFSESRIILFASEREGLPFALIEGMASGAVPISTAVGTIPSFIENGRTGFLVPSGNVKALSATIIRLLDDERLYHYMYNKILEKRKELSFENVATIWSKFIQMM